LITICSSTEPTGALEELEIPSDLTPEEAIAYIETVCSAVRGVHVGSAGNSGFDFPFYPAAWVRSVSAAEDGNRADYTNFNANTGLVGGWFQLGEIALSPPGVLNFVTAPVYYRGTSFSGPVESVCIALDIGSEADCQSISNP
jgi:hypothetical protein